MATMATAHCIVIRELEASHTGFGGRQRRGAAPKPTGEHVDDDGSYFLHLYVADIWKEVMERTGFKKKVKFLGLPRHWLFETLTSCSEKEATILTISLWHIWEARNAI